MSDATSFKTDQERFWAGEFGTDYVGRNNDDAFVASNVSLFSRALRRTEPLRDCVEFGANVGLNPRALSILYPAIRAHAIEINANAARALERFVPKENIHLGSILEFEPARVYDLVLIKGVLIHINPDCLNEVYDKLYRSCGRYLLVCEYYSPVPTSVPYRGHQDRLFKRDFAGEMLDRYRDLALLDYGFAYRRDPNYPQDDLNWFLLGKRAGPAA